MITSRDRILTTHVGSLPRNEALSELLVKREAGEAYDRARFEQEMDKAVRHVVERQKAAGIDIGNDGEQQRVGFQTYVPARMAGFAGVSKRRRGREFEEFPELVSYLLRRFPHTSRQQNAPECQGELHYLDIAPLEAEIARFKSIAAGAGAFSECFMTAPSPGIVGSTMLNAHYPSHQAYLDAIAREMKNEYQAIHRAGLILQIDAPDLAMDRTMMFRDLSDAEFVGACERGVAAINAGIEGIPRDRVRLHVLLRQLGRPAHPRHRAGEDPAGALPGEGGGAVDRVLQPAPRARIRRAEGPSFAEGHGPDPGRDRDHQQLRRAPAGRGAAHRGGGGGGGRPRAGDRLHRLRLRHLHQPRVGDRTGGVAQTQVAARRRGHRLGPPVGKGSDPGQTLRV